MKSLLFYLTCYLTFSAFSLINQIVSCKYKKQQNVMPATHSNKVGTVAKQHWNVYK